MRKMLTAIALFVAVALQAQTFSTSGWWKPAEPPFSPVVGADGMITFRLKAPKARVVKLAFGEGKILVEIQLTGLTLLVCQQLPVEVQQQALHHSVLSHVAAPPVKQISFAEYNRFSSRCQGFFLGSAFARV